MRPHPLALAGQFNLITALSLEKSCKKRALGKLWWPLPTAGEIIQAARSPAAPQVPLQVC
jgi:hypothetical protein